MWLVRPDVRPSSELPALDDCTKCLLTISAFSCGAGDACPWTPCTDLVSKEPYVLGCSLPWSALPAAAGDSGLSGGVPNLVGVPKRGGLLPKEPCSAVVRAVWPGTTDGLTPAPARGGSLSGLVWLDGLFDAAGDDARRAVDVAREAESAGDLSRKASDDDEPGTGRGLDGDEACLCPDIGVRSRS